MRVLPGSGRRGPKDTAPRRAARPRRSPRGASRRRSGCGRLRRSQSPAGPTWATLLVRSLMRGRKAFQTRSPSTNSFPSASARPRSARGGTDCSRRAGSRRRRLAIGGGGKEHRPAGASRERRWPARNVHGTGNGWEAVAPERIVATALRCGPANADCHERRHDARTQAAGLGDLRDRERVEQVCPALSRVRPERAEHRRCRCRSRWCSRRSSARKGQQRARRRPARAEVLQRPAHRERVGRRLPGDVDANIPIAERQVEVVLPTRRCWWSWWQRRRPIARPGLGS